MKVKEMFKMIKNNKGLIIFLVAIVIFAVIYVNHVDKDNDRMNAAKLQERS